MSAEPAALRRKAAARVQLEDVDLDRAVVVLVDHRNLVGTGRAREATCDEARLCGPDLIRTGVVEAAIAGIANPRRGRLEVEELQIEVVLRVRDQDPRESATRERAGEQIARAPPIKIRMAPHRSEVSERASGRDPLDEPHRVVAVVVEDGDVGLAVGVEIESRDLHASEVEAVPRLEEPL